MREKRERPARRSPLRGPGSVGRLQHDGVLLASLAGLFKGQRSSAGGAVIAARLTFDSHILDPVPPRNQDRMSAGVGRLVRCSLGRPASSCQKAQESHSTPLPFLSLESPTEPSPRCNITRKRRPVHCPAPLPTERGVRKGGRRRRFATTAKPSQTRRLPPASHGRWQGARRKPTSPARLCGRRTR